ncbi:MAG: zonular occludens toxin domain-containing protein [Nanoarchaeota archaeon]
MVRKKGKKYSTKIDTAEKKEAAVILKVLGFIVKSPYYLAKKLKNSIEKNKIESKRESIASVYDNFKVIETLNGNYSNWEKTIFNSDSKIGIIIGARGSGKTAFGIKFIENIYAKKKVKCYAIGFKADDFPSWINVVSDISEITNNSYVLIDEGGILFSSRDSMSKPNKLLSDLILVARHKNLNILFISQNSSNLDVNILRQADYLVLKQSSLLQKDFERKIIQKIYSDIEDKFEKHKEVEGLTYIHSGDFSGFISNKLPSFWKTEISKSFK